jgi:hypothetical protein
MGFLALFVSHQGSNRVPPMHDLLQTSDVKDDHHFSYFFVDYTDQNTTGIPNLAVTEQYRALERLAASQRGFQAALLAKYFFAFNYVIGETKARWIYRGADDTMVDIALLRQYINKLNRRYDPLSEVVVRGHCISVSGHQYPQGGSGVILSRRAVEKIAPMGLSVLTGMNQYEDIQFGLVLRRIGVNIETEAECRAFIGTPFTDSDRRALEAQDFSFLPKCPDNPCPSCPCTRFLAPLRQVIFTHTLNWYPFQQRLAVSRGASNAPRNVYWHHRDALYPSLCRLENRIVPGWVEDDHLL